MTAIPSKMKVARLHEVGAPLKIEFVDTPIPAEADVLVRVRACGIVPNLANVLMRWPTISPNSPLPLLPAIFGLDPAGEVVSIGPGVSDIKVGDRVYVNPGRSCGNCRYCAAGDNRGCEYYTLNGYFGFSSSSERIFRRYPYGGFGEYMTAPATALVRLKDNVSYAEAARFGYIGTAYSGLKKARVKPGTSVLINGASGTLGIGAVISALAMGASKILGTGRNRDLLELVRAISPDRIEVLSTNDGSIVDWAKRHTDGKGVDVAIDCVSRTGGHEMFIQAIQSVRRGGCVVDVGAVAGEVPINLGYMMARNMTLYASLWFTTEEAQQLAEQAASGSLNLSIFEHRSFPLEDVNEAVSLLESRHGGFSNYVINP